MDRGTWQAAVHGVANSQPQLSTSESMYVRILPLITRLFIYFCNREVFNARTDPSTLLSTRGLEVNKPEHFSEEGITVFWLVKVKLQVTQSCPTLCNPIDYTVHGILQARILEWVAFPFSRRSSQPRD